MGRASEYSQELADIICERMICGADDKPESLRSICRDDGMPRLGTVMRWLAKYPEFREQYRAAREAQAEVHHEEILEISDNCTDDVQTLLGNDDETTLGRINHSAVARAKLQVDTRKWIMSRMVPKKYGDKIQQLHSDPDGKPLPAAQQNTVFLGDLQGHSLDELTRLFTEKLKS
ncbi:hypothetical protein PX52LOC_01667 [Limnoglobus roseus]|uniref:Uncharacterized protein n=2 Tax=Limnoglobus roseus TaxID=2598579 RepID=A0A5C1A992_9BACT|nr:hypothetical protein PX52LOC_01667 [Limnoglobus roseus]